MIGMVVKNVIGLGLPLILRPLAKKLGGGIEKVNTPIAKEGSRTSAFALGLTWVGVVFEVITQLNEMPMQVEALFGTKAGALLAVLGVLVQAYREITRGPVKG